MTTPLSRAALDAILARHAASTPGEWTADPDGGYVRLGVREWVAQGRSHADAAFIACAHQDVQLLIAEVLRLRRDLAQQWLLHAQVSRHKPLCDCGRCIVSREILAEQE